MGFTISAIKIPSSKDIYIEINGIKAAVIESYSATTTRTASVIEEFGSDIPICSVGGKTLHELKLSRVYFISDEIKNSNFHKLSGFSIVIVKPDRRILYNNCEWVKIEESAKLSQPCIETMTVIASDRIEV